MFPIKKDGFNTIRICICFTIISSLLNCVNLQLNTPEKLMYASFKEYTIIMENAVIYTKNLTDKEEKEKIKSELINISDKVYKVYLEARVDSTKISDCLIILNTSINQIKEIIKE